MTSLPTTLLRNTVGFDSLLREFDRALSHGHQQSNYPPYNLYRRGDDRFFIEIAVAGFSKDDINVELKRDHLTVSAQSDRELADGVEVIHNGIAERAFERTFRLAENIEVDSVKLDNGLLKIELHRNIPEKDIAKRLEIK